MRIRRARGLAVILFAALASPAWAASAYVRVNQLGYERSGAARAYLVTPTADPGATFAVKTAAGKVVVSGNVGASTGAWGNFTVYPIDFTVNSAGTYSISIGGTISVTSGAFAVNTPARLYASALANALSFYQNERDGADYIPSALRIAPGHLNDEDATAFETPPLNGGKIVGNLVPTGVTLDASGGWWDAGDYLKFVETHSYTVGMMLTGVRDFPAEMGPGSDADFSAEAAFGLNWLLKMWDDGSQTLYYEVGVGIDFKGQKLLSDHDLWRLPQVDDTLGGNNPDYIYIQHRPVFAAGTAGATISPNLAGRLAADFALCFLDERATDLPQAQQCLLAGEHVFDLADTNPGKLLTALPYGFYPETEWRDDLEWGATELNLALALGGNDIPAGLPHTASSYYLTQAANWAHAYITGPNDAADTLNLYDVSGLAHFDLIRAITLAGNPGGLAVTQADLLADLLKQLTKATKQAGKDPFGFGFPWAASDTTSHGDGLSVMADEYFYLAGGSAWSSYATQWLGNVLGANIWGVSLLVGDGTNFTDCLQHQVANISGSLTGGTPVLAGAAVEGPSARNAVASGYLNGMKKCPASGSDMYKIFTGNGARFKDNVQNYANTEPAIDLTATSPLMLAWRIAGAPAALH